jgi:hypothetical protein
MNGRPIGQVPAETVQMFDQHDVDLSAPAEQLTTRTRITGARLWARHAAKASRAACRPSIRQQPDCDSESVDVRVIRACRFSLSPPAL